MRTNDEALTYYIAHMAEIEAIVETLAEYVEDHGGIAPDDVTWAHASAAAEARNSLRRVAKFLGIPAPEAVHA